MRYKRGIKVYKGGREYRQDTVITLGKELTNLANEFSNLGCDFKDYESEFGSSINCIEGRIAIMDKNINTRLDAIESEIKKTHTAFHSVMKEQPS